MRLGLSHGRLQLICTLALVTGAFVAGAQIFYESRRDIGRDLEEVKTQEVSSQDRLLVDSLWGVIDSIRTRALAIYEIRESQGANKAAPAGSLLDWAEVEVQDGRAIAIRQSAINPAWSEGKVIKEGEPADAAYLRAAMRKFDLSQIAQNGVALARIKPDNLTGHEKLALAFSLPQPRKNVIMALVDPEEAFTVFRRWIPKSEVGNLRAYLIAGDGRVLVHSQSSYLGADFGGVSLFQNDLKPIFSGVKASGSSHSSAVDLLPVRAAFTRLGTLPMVAVVERVIPRNASPFTLNFILDCMIRLTILVVLGFVLVVANLEADSESEKKPERAKKRDANWTTLLSQPSHPVHAQPKTSFVKPVVEKMRDENEDEEITQPEIHYLPESSAVRVKIEQFEAEALKLKDPRKIAAKMTALVHDLVKKPVLFFTYHAGVKAAILQAYSGFTAENRPPGMSFPLTFDALIRLGESDFLNEYEPLARIIQNRLNTKQFVAWPILGSDGKLMGALLVLQSRAALEAPEVIDQLLKASGIIYEQARVV